METKSKDDYKYSLRFLIIPQIVYADTRLSKLDSFIVGFINTYTGQTFRFGNRKLAKMFGVTPGAVSKSIGRLKKTGYIDYTIDVDSEGVQIRHINKLFEDLNSLQEFPVGNVFPEEVGGDSSGTRGGIPSELQKDNITKATIINNSASDLAMLEQLGLVETEEQQKKPKQSFGNENINLLLDKLAEYSGFKPNGKDHRRYATHIYNALHPFLGTGKRKKDREWQDDDWQINLENLLKCYKERFKDFKYLTVDKIYFNVLKPWAENKGVLPPANNFKPANRNFKQEDTSKYSKLVYSEQ